MSDKAAWKTSRKDMDSFLAFVPSELEEGFVVYAYPPGDSGERVAFYGPDARERADDYAALQNDRIRDRAALRACVEALEHARWLATDDSVGAVLFVVGGPPFRDTAAAALALARAALGEKS